MGRIALGTLAYVVITFPLAFVWHLVVFKETYERLGYFSRKEPIVAFGFLAILLQGILLSYLYPLVSRSRSVLAGGAIFATVMGGYHWTIHVLAEAAKHPIEPLPTWFGLESVYLAIQFMAGGLVLAVIYRNSASPRDAQGVT